MDKHSAERFVKLKDGKVVYLALPSIGMTGSVSMSHMHGQRKNGPPTETPLSIRPVSYFAKK